MTIWLDPLTASLALALNLAPAVDPARLAAARPGLAAVVAELTHPVFKAKLREVSNWRFEAAAAIEAPSNLAARLTGGRGSLPRCVKLNNYWCIKKAGWAGEIAADGEGHVAFASAREGAIVAAKLLRRYYMDFGRHDAMAIVSHWAPAQCGFLAVRAPRLMRVAPRLPARLEKTAKAGETTGKASAAAPPKRYNPGLMRPIPRPLLKALKPLDEASAAQAEAASSKAGASKPVQSGSAKSTPNDARRAAAPAHHHLASLGPALHALATHSLGTTLRARWLATHRPGGMPRRSATTRVAQVHHHAVHHHAAHRARLAAAPVRAVAKPAEKVAAIMAGEPDISLAPVRLASLGSFELLPAVPLGPLTSCSGDTQRIHNYAERAIAGIVQGTHDDLKLFSEDGTPGANLLPMMLNMAKVEIGPLGARPSLIAAAIAAAFPGKHPASPDAEAPAP